MRAPTLLESVCLSVLWVASLGGIFWFVRYAPKPHGLLETASEFCSLMCVLVLFILSLAMRCAEIARANNWSPQQCRWRPILPAVLILSFCALKLSLVWVIATLFVSAGGLAGTLCRWLVYPTADAEQAYKDDQRLHLLSK
jgi:hypothetical protein